MTCKSKVQESGDYITLKRKSRERGRNRVSSPGEGKRHGSVTARCLSLISVTSESMKVAMEIEECVDLRR